MFLVIEKILFPKMGIGVVFISRSIFSPYRKSFGSNLIGGASNTVTLHILNLREIGGFFFYRYITKNLLKYIKSWQLLGNCNNLLKFLLDFIPFYIEKELSQYPF